MNDTRMTCNDRLLVELLQETLSQEVSEDVLTHVENCAHCQDRLTTIAASPEEWKIATEAISDPCVSDHSAFRLNFPAASDSVFEWTEPMAKRLLSPASHPEMLGRLGRYDVERLIGSGGMGVVFKAFDQELNRPVAIKLLAPYLAGSGSARQRFLREAKGAAAVGHRHVVPIYNVETGGEIPFLVMQYVAGESLQERIDREGPLGIREILRIGKQIAEGLSAAHLQGLVHRDIKPSNILLEEGIESAMISDFGLARAIDDASLTRTGFHPGTPQYMSPEQAAGETVDTRSDLFSLGSLLYAMCTGRPPFRAESSLGVLKKITESNPTPIRELNSDIPLWLCTIIDRLLAKKPADRFQSAAEVAKLLESCLAHTQQPTFYPLPAELRSLDQENSERSLFRTLLKEARGNMVKIVSISSLAILAFAFYSLFQQESEQAQKLQGEWRAVAMSTNGVELKEDQLFNSRLIVDGNRFSRKQTAPNGKEIAGESGKLVVGQNKQSNAIDLRMRGGTAYGIFKVDRAKLVLCVTQNGGERPTEFESKAGENRVLTTYVRVEKEEPEAVGETDRNWIESMSKKFPSELPTSLAFGDAEKYLRDQKFTELRSGAISSESKSIITPDLDETKLFQSGIRNYVYGLLRSTESDEPVTAIEVYLFFDETGKYRVCHIGPALKQVREEDNKKPNANENSK